MGSSDRRSGAGTGRTRTDTAGAGRSPAEGMGDAGRVAVLVLGEQPARGGLVHRGGVRLFPVRRGARTPDADSARVAGQRLPVRGTLQPDLHGSWVRDDVPVRSPDLRGVFDPGPAGDAGGAGPAV